VGIEHSIRANNSAIVALLLRHLVERFPSYRSSSKVRNGRFHMQICRPSLSAIFAISFLFHMWFAYCLLYRIPRCSAEYTEPINSRQSSWSPCIYTSVARSIAWIPDGRIYIGLRICLVFVVGTSKYANTIVLVVLRGAKISDTRENVPGSGVHTLCNEDSYRTLRRPVSR
jgi:hypothetical protein